MSGSVACKLFEEVLHHVVTLWFTVDEDVEAQLFLLGDHQLDLIDHEQGRPANTNRSHEQSHRRDQG
ncbi:hypothetical protein CIP107575_02140 [Corynebacterium diphtheriae]|nr:hypothetical protein CIP107575_02140 [Corynebacterium diphtheriae]